MIYAGVAKIIKTDGLIDRRKFIIQSREDSKEVDGFPYHMDCSN